MIEDHRYTTSLTKTLDIEYIDDLSYIFDIEFIHK